MGVVDLIGFVPTLVGLDERAETGGGGEAGEKPPSPMKPALWTRLPRQSALFNERDVLVILRRETVSRTPSFLH